MALVLVLDSMVAKMTIFTETTNGNYCYIHAQVLSTDLSYRLTFLFLLSANLVVMVICYYSSNQSELGSTKRSLALILTLIVIYHFVAHFPVVIVSMLGIWAGNLLMKVPFLFMVFRIIHFAGSLVRPVLWLSLSKDIQDGIIGRSQPSGDVEMRPCT